MADLTLSVARDYSRTPGSRYETEGEASGEVFRQTLLVPKVREALQGKRTLLVDLDGTAGYATSFLEEAFGGLVRVEGLSAKTLHGILEIKSTEEDYLIADVWSYIDEARAE